MEANKFTINEDYKDIAILKNKSITNLKSCFNSFCHTIENSKILSPDKYSQIFRWEEDKENKIIKLSFTYSFLNEDSQTIKINLQTSLPIFFGLLWDVQQSFLIMEEMYILKLNEQILNKLIK
jgi:hypothetical protein|tara:strand:+ start:451 stop:819 length:369 start_codon:yes stop_codon:yes gene_type:complete